MSRTTPTFQCLRQPLLVAGCERTPAALVGGSAILCAVMAWFSWSPLALAAAALLFGVGIPFLQQLAKRDPKMVEIAFRFFLYHRNYPAHLMYSPARRSWPIVLAWLAILVALLVWWLL